ncbi:SIR2 family protein [Zunongwangia sp. H14]|uniref:SIR2 family protein n=1 Tax=Zunongwangia sp. H14 TaxID=3240792 RepID=UPI00356AE8E6
MKINSKIQEAIRNNRLVIFTGSGLSTKFGLPTWDTLVKQVVQDVDNSIYTPFISLMENGLMEPSEVLEKLKPEHNQIKKYILKNFKVSTTDDLELHQKLLELTGQIITTNYDNAFELASNNKINPTVHTSTFNVSEINKNEQEYIFKIHGSYNEPDSCIVFQDQYKSLYSKSAAKEKLKSVFAEKVILFLGFSFKDPDISFLFNTLDNIYENNIQHFIITPNPKEFDNFNFLKTIEIEDYREIEVFVNSCLEFKKSGLKEIEEPSKEILTKQKRVALISPNPIDLELREDILNVISNFDSLSLTFLLGTLNINTLLCLDDYDLIIIVSTTFKGKVYVEEQNLQSNLMEPIEIFRNIPNEKRL